MRMRHRIDRDARKRLMAHGWERRIFEHVLARLGTWGLLQGAVRGLKEQERGGIEW